MKKRKNWTIKLRNELGQKVKTRTIILKETQDAFHFKEYSKNRGALSAGRELFM
jgi:hypothetical protein